MNSILKWSTNLYRRPWAVLIAVFGLTVFFALGIPLLRINTDLKQMLPENSRQRMLSDYYDSEQVFGSSNAILIGIEARDLYSLETLTYIKSLTDRLEALNDTVPARLLAMVLRLSPEEGARVLEALRSVGINAGNHSEELTNRLRSADALQREFGWDSDFSRKVAAAAAKATDTALWTSYRSPLGRIQSLVNADFITYENDSLVSKKLIDQEEVTRETISGLKERVHSWSPYEGMLVSKDDTLTSIIVTLGATDAEVKGALNAELVRLTANPPTGIRVFIAGEPVVDNQVGLAITQDLPFLIPTVLFVMVVFLFLSFRSVKGVVYPLLVTLVSIIWALGTMGYLGVTINLLTSVIPVLLMAIVLSGITVMFGFGALAVQEFVPIREFGVFTALGDLVGLLGALFLLPALLLLGGEVKPAPRIRREDTRSDDPIQKADVLLNQKMAGTKTLSVVLDSDLSDPIHREGPRESASLATPEVLSAVDQFAVDVQKRFPIVTTVRSFTDVMKKINQVMNEGRREFYTVPADGNLISQYLLLFSGDTQSMLTEHHDKLRIVLILNGGGAQQAHEIATYAQSYFSSEFRTKNHFQVVSTGDQELFYAFNQITTKGSLESIVLCFVLVLILLVSILRSPVMSLIAAIPILIAVLVDFGAIGSLRVPLNLATAMVSSVSIGIGVDFSIHFITWYRRELLQDRNVLAAADRTILHKGRAILYNLFVIVGGFLVLLGSRLIPLQQFGWLTAMCMVTAAVSALVVVPALLKLLARKNCRFLYLGLFPESSTIVSDPVYVARGRTTCLSKSQ